MKLGRQRSPEHHNGPNMRPYLRVANVYDARLDLSDVLKMNFTPQEYETFQLRPGDVLVNEGQSLEWVGRSAIYRGEVPGACFQNTLIRFRPKPFLLSEFALLVFRHYVFSQRYRRIAKWTTNIAHLGSERFAEVEFPLPPLNEQRRIVEEADKQLTSLDAGVAALKRVQAQLKRYRASVLKAACEGRLVPTEAELACSEKRDYESADKLLERILKERRARWEADQLAKMKAAGKPPKDDRWRGTYRLDEPRKPYSGGVLPDGWVAVPLTHVADVQLGQQRAPVHAEAERQYPYLRAANITWAGLDLSDVKTMGFPNPERYLLRRGDLLLVEASGSPLEVGKPALWRGDIEECLYQKTLLRVRARGGVSPQYLYFWFLQAALSGRFARESPGVGIVHITAERLSEWWLPLPPLVEQDRIVRQLEATLSSVDSVLGTVERGHTRAGRLRKAVLQQAFEGTLVAQDPRDEPASKLVERDSASAEAAEAPAKKSTKRIKKEGASEEAGHRG